MLTHGLLAHGRLVGVAGRLVVVREGDDGSTDSQNHGRVDLAVSVCLDGGGIIFCSCLQILHRHGNHGGLLFLCVHIPEQAEELNEQQM